MKNPCTRRKIKRKNESEKTVTGTEKEGGYMTVFACLLFLVISSAVFLCLDGILLFQGRSKSGMYMAGAGEHLMANYNEPLASRYGLFFLDPRMRQNMKSRTITYLEDAWNLKSGLFPREPLVKLELIEAEAWGMESMDENEHSSFKAQIEETMAYDLTKDMAFQILGDASENTEEYQNKIDELADELEGLEKRMDSSEYSAETALIPSNFAENEENQEFGPELTVRSLLKNGVLSYVTGNRELSGEKISSSDLPSQYQKEKKVHLSLKLIESITSIKEVIKEQDLEHLVRNFSDNAAMALYCKNYFSNYKNSKETSVLQYEFEYILGGFLSDKANLEYVMNRLVLLRFAWNAVRILADPVKNEKALSKAAAFAGFTGSPALVESVKYVILALESFQQGIEDVKLLAEGKRLSISGEEGEKGLSYEEHLMILFLMKADQDLHCYRMQDLMQVNIQEMQPEFRILDCCSKVGIKTVVRQRMLFFPKTFEYQWEKEYSY